LEVDAVIFVQHSSFADTVKYNPYDGPVWHAVVDSATAYVCSLLQDSNDLTDREMFPGDAPFPGHQSFRRMAGKKFVSNCVPSRLLVIPKCNVV